MSGGYLLYSAPNLKNTYIKKLKLLEQEPFTDLAKNIEGAKERYFELKQSFNVFLQVKFNLETLTKNLENWYELSFGDFLKELKKKKVILTLSEEAEWMPYFEEQKAKVIDLRTQIDRIDAEIDQMVYQLYGLTDEEIAIVEEAVG